MRFRLTPRDRSFFPLFEQAAGNLLEGARRLQHEIEDFTDLEAKHAAVVQCERRGDELTREILRKLNSTYVTPFDREDIHALAEELDDVVDDMLAVSDLLRLLSIGAILPELKKKWIDTGKVKLIYRDFPLLQATIILKSILILTINLGVDILYAYVDPRIRLA